MDRTVDRQNDAGYRAVLFDLDGTLTDPKEGITKSVQYALKAFGIEEPDLDKLEPFIGPPLLDSFMEIYGFTEENATRAIEKYRERFANTGIFENYVYGGIPELLRSLKDAGMVLAVASSKPGVFVERILEKFGISGYFDVVTGSELNGTRSRKEEVVEEALARVAALTGSLDKRRTVMVGDRKYDVEGAKSHGIACVGVTFGYGSREELIKAGADFLAGSVEDLSRLLL